MKKRVVSLFGPITVMLFLLVTSSAWAYQFNDVTQVQEWRYNGLYGSGSWTDVIGDANVFNTFGANLSGSIFTIFTNWNPTKDGYLGVNTADLFIDNNSDGAFDYAIRLDTTSGIGTVYVNPTFQTSQDLLSGTGYIYGGRHNNASPSPVPVWTTTSTSTYSTSVVWTVPSNGLNNQVDVDLSTLGLGSNWSFVWGTSTCSNDAFDKPVPEPASMLLLGSGLIGLWGFRKKFKK
jgi:hypothetical protein